MITLAIDNFGARGRPLPNGGDSMDYPALFYYLRESGMDVQVKQTEEAPQDAWYVMKVKWFDFTVDYLALVNPTVLARNMKIVFLYDEADNPAHIDERLFQLAEKHGHDNMVFVTGNTDADQHVWTTYWPEREYLYRRSVGPVRGSKTHFKRRSKHFTGLCRIDKLWRKIFMSNLWKKGLHHRGYFSYCQTFLGEQDDWDGIPLLNEFIESRELDVDEFITAGPFLVDQLSDQDRNNDAVLAEHLYQDSYFNIVLETNIDADSSGGQCITEKTLKPILNCQPFICVAEHHHLAHLHELGYATFDSLWKEDYDDIQDTQQRFEAVMRLSEELIRLPLDELHYLYQRAQPILEHNRKVLANYVPHRLQDLVEKIMNRP